MEPEQTYSCRNSIEGVQGPRQHPYPESEALLPVSEALLPLQEDVEGISSSSMSPPRLRGSAKERVRMVVGKWLRTPVVALLVGLVFRFTSSRLLAEFIEGTCLSRSSTWGQVAHPWRGGVHSPPKIGQTPRLWIRSVANEKGIGSTLQRIKGGIILSADEVMGELFEDLNNCYRDFVRQRIGALDGRRLERPLSPSISRAGGPENTKRRNALSCGVHIRWRDAAMYEGTMEAPRGSMQLAYINEIISKLRARFTELDIRVVIENANAAVLNLLNFKDDYTLVDSGDSFADLFSLADNDVMLLGGSSYGALAHLVAPSRGLSIVEGLDEPNKYRDSTHRSLVLDSGRNVDFVQKIAELFPQVEKNITSTRF